jgi:hypothetical protein
MSPARSRAAGCASAMGSSIGRLPARRCITAADTGRATGSGVAALTARSNQAGAAQVSGRARPSRVRKAMRVVGILG